MSTESKIAKDLIKFFTSQHIIGPKIKDGTLRRRMKQVPWRCPDGFQNMKIKMKHFDMDFLVPLEPDCGEVVLQLHGGGYMGRIHNAYRDFAVRYSHMSSCRKVLSIDYRVAPENPYPAALEDALAAYHWLLDAGYKGRNIIIAGDSAGGGLVLCLAMYLRDHGIELPKCLIMMSPWTDLTLSGESYESNYDHDPLFGKTKDSLVYIGAREYTKGSDPRNPYISPIYGDFAGLPPMLYQVGSIELLLSDTLTCAKKAEETGCKVKLTVYEGMFHVFQMAAKFLPEAKEAWMEIEDFINQL